MNLVIADDHEVVRDGLRWMLEPVDDITVVDDVGSGEQLLERIEGEGAVDVVLLDLRMPRMSGFQVLERIREASPDVRILVLSMHDEPAFIRRAFELGADGYVLKNTERDELIDALRTVHGGDRYLSAQTGTALIPGRRASGSLTPRELEIVRLISEGLENKQIARLLGLSEATVKSYLKSAFARLGVSSRAEAVAVAIRAGLIE